jgi:NADH-quinone oxidoreductase subunit M
MIIAAIYILYLVGKVCFGPLREPAGHGQHGHGHDHDANGDDHLPADLTAREIGILVPLAVLCVALGFYPKPLMRVVEPTVRDTARLIQDTRAKMPEYDLSPMPRVTPKAASAPEARP